MNKTLNIEGYAEEYFKELNTYLTNIPKADIKSVEDSIYSAYCNEKKIFIMGNGGSASTASHFANDLNKLCAIEGKKRFKAISLTDCIPWVTAIANDISYDAIFVEQLKNLLEKDDMIIAISGSGNSKNVVKAAIYGKENNAKVIGFLGFDGGKLEQIVDTRIIIPTRHYGIIEDAHLVLSHLLSNHLRERIAKGQ